MLWFCFFSLLFFCVCFFFFVLSLEDPADTQTSRPVISVCVVDEESQGKEGPQSGQVLVLTFPPLKTRNEPRRPVYRALGENNVLIGVADKELWRGTWALGVISVFHFFLLLAGHKCHWVNYLCSPKMQKMIVNMNICPDSPLFCVFAEREQGPEPGLGPGRLGTQEGGRPGESFFLG